MKTPRNTKKRQIVTEYVNLYKKIYPERQATTVEKMMADRYLTEKYMYSLMHDMFHDKLNVEDIIRKYKK